MDLKLKGKRWLSNKPQTWLGTVLSDIDGFIRDKSVHAANQEPTVGDSVKTDCPNVIQDLLPCYLEEPGKFEAQFGSSKHSDINETYFNSKLDIGEKHVDTEVNKFSAELDPVGQSNSTNKEFSDLASGSCIGKADADLPSGLEVDILEHTESNGTIDEIIMVVRENDSKETQSDKSSDNVVEKNSTNDKPGKLDVIVGSLECNGSFETCFKSMLSIGDKPVDTQASKFSVKLEVDPLSNSHEEFLDLPCGNFIGEADDYLSSGLEIDALKDSGSNGVLDEIIIAKEEELIDRKNYIVLEENYMGELTHRNSDNSAEAKDKNDNQLYSKFDIVEDYCPEKSSWQGGLDQCFPETEKLLEKLLLSESTRENICSVENRAVDIELTSSSTSLYAEIYSALQLPHIDDSHPEEDICNSPRHALGCASKVPTANLICNPQDCKLACSSESNMVDSVSGTPAVQSSVENKTVNLGLASSNAASLSTETSRVFELPHEDISNCKENICRKPVHADRCPFETLPQSSVCHSRKDKLACSRELNIVNGIILGTPALPPPEADLSGICVENEAVDMGFASSNTSLSTQSYSTQELSRCEESICSNHVPAVRCASDIPYSVSSSHTSQTSTRDHSFADSTVSSSIMSMLSNGESCKVAIEDPGMETIELVEKAKPDGSCVIVDSGLLHAASFRALRNKSYTKILQDAFASRKRLRKEYEQLAILYGDIDFETNPQSAIDLLSSAASSSHDSENSFPESSDPDWELL